MNENENDIKWYCLNPLPARIAPFAFVSSSLAMITIKASQTFWNNSAAQCNSARAWCDNLLPVSAIHPVHCLHGRLGEVYAAPGLTSHQWTLQLGCQSDRRFPGIVTIAPVEILTPSQANCLAAFAWRSIFAAINKEIWTSAPVHIP